MFALWVIIYIYTVHLLEITVRMSAQTLKKDTIKHTEFLNFPMVEYLN